jgi:uncharacterized protein YjcR
MEVITQLQLGRKKRGVRGSPKVNAWRAYLLWKTGYEVKDIALKFDCSPQAIYQAIDPIKDALLTPEEIEYYNKNRLELFQSAECLILGDFVEPVRRKKASFNNTAYGLRQINEIRRLEQGLSSINIDIRTEKIETIKLQQEIEETRAGLESLKQSAQETGNPETATIIDVDNMAK